MRAAVATLSISSVPARQSCRHQLTAAPPLTLVLEYLGPIKTMFHLVLVTAFHVFIFKVFKMSSYMAAEFDRGD